jgi:hypothetical protein
MGPPLYSLHSIHQTKTPLDSIRNAYLTQSLIQLRQQLETKAPLDQLTIPADELFCYLLVTIDLPIESINIVLGTDYQPHNHGEYPYRPLTLSLSFVL